MVVPTNHHSTNGLQLFYWCQILAEAWLASGHLFAPSGARIFYYTQLVAQRLGFPVIAPTTHQLPQERVAVFLRKAILIGPHLEAEFERVVRIRANPVAEGMWLMTNNAAPQFPGLVGLLAAMGGRPGLSTQDLLDHWDSCWNELAGKPLPASWSIFRPEVLPVAVVARPEDSDRAALRLLKAQLKADKRLRTEHIPAPDVYLFDEPFLEWFTRSLLAQYWFPAFWQGQFN